MLGKPNDEANEADEAVTVDDDTTTSKSKYAKKQVNSRFEVSHVTERVYSRVRRKEREDKRAKERKKIITTKQQKATPVRRTI